VEDGYVVQLSPHTWSGHDELLILLDGVVRTNYLLPSIVHQDMNTTRTELRAGEIPHACFSELLKNNINGHGF
jgi:hypothetical protein